MIFTFNDHVLSREPSSPASVGAVLSLHQVDPEHHGSGSGSEGSAAEGSEAADLGADLGAFEEERV